MSFSSSTSSFSYEWSYDVFLSFRGTDTRHGFAGYLYKALCDKGIHTFFDDEEVQTGKEISPTLAKAIEESRIGMIVFSKNYAHSSFCLEELVKIMECVKGKDRLVIPIFYDVDPSHVRHQRGSYEEAMAKHEERFKDDIQKVHIWKKALHQAANLSGRHFKHGEGYEHEFIGKIVEDLSRKIKRVVLPIADYPVGLEKQLLNIRLLLDVGNDDDVRMVGIHGNGGIGKTTLALAVYNMIADHFQGLCFLENLRENSIKHGLVHLQNVLLSEVLGERKLKSTSVQQGISIIQRRFRRKKVLLIVDDVDKLEQLQALVGKPDWFGPGTRIIVTTRDKHLLACHGIERTYEVKGLSEGDALELLRWKAFKTDNVDPSYMDVLDRVVSYACGLPLALEVIGSNLFGKSEDEWKFALDQYEKIPHKDIQKILKISFDALEEYQQNIFLDIACYYKGYIFTEFEAILHAQHGINPNYGIRVLVEKSLIKMNDDGYVTLHDLIQDMGREIVRQESPKDPGKRSRLWLIEDIIQVLEEKRGTDQIESIVLDAPIPENAAVEWDGEGFKKMRNLKTLIIRNVLFSNGAKHLPNSLRVLEWWSYPSKSLPCDFHPKNLFIFKMPHSNLISIRFLEKQKLMNMTVLILDDSNIDQIPDLSGVPMLEKLTFSRCYYLIKVHESVGFLDKLGTLSAYSCRNLRSFPPLMLPSLKNLHLSWCTSLDNFPEILGKMECIQEIDLWGTSIKELPFSFTNLTKLKRLNLEGKSRGIEPMGKRCGMIELQSSTLRNLEELILLRPQGVRFPSPNGGEVEQQQQGISMASSNAKKVSFQRCNLSDESVPMVLAWFRNVVSLDLSRNNFTVLPESIKELVFLRDFSLDDCIKLEEIRGIPPNMKCFSARNCISLTFSSRRMLLDEDLHQGGDDFERFMLPGTSIPRWFKERSNQGSISYWFRNKLPTISLCVVIGPNIYPSCIVPELIINGYEQLSVLLYEIDLYEVQVADHIIIIDQKLIISDYDELDDGLISENEWNHVVCRVTTQFPGSPTIKIIGIYLPKHKNNMEDIRFKDPFSLALSEARPRRKRVSQHLHPIMTSLNDNVQDTDTGIDSKLHSLLASCVEQPLLHSLLALCVEQPLDDAYKDALTISLKNHDKDSDDVLMETTIVPAATSLANYGSFESSIHTENADQPVPQPLDPLAELERVLSGSYDLSPRSCSPNAASCSDIQTSAVVTILQNLESLLDNPLESLIADGEIKHQILDCLSKLWQLEDHISISLQSVIAQVRDFYEDLIHNFPLIQQTLVDYACLEETRSKFLENLKHAKVKQAQIEAEASREKNQVKELDAEIDDLEKKLKAAVEKRNELQLAVKNSEAEKNKILEDASAWLIESKQVVEKMRSSEHAYKDAQNSKANLEGKLATLKRAFAANKP